MIIERFDEISGTQAGEKFLNELPFEEFLRLMENPELNVTDEY